MKSSEYAATTRYTVRRYADDQAIGESRLTAEQMSHYEALSQQPQGLITLGDMPSEYYDIDPEYQDLPADTTIYLD